VDTRRGEHERDDPPRQPHHRQVAERRDAEGGPLEPERSLGDTAVDGGASTRLAAAESATVVVEWRVDVLAGNEVQSDRLAALLRFRLTATA
jgi:hypothetical protein